LTAYTMIKLASAGVKYHRFPRPAFFTHTLLSSALLYTNSQGGTSPLIWRLSRRNRKGFHHCHTACSLLDRRHWTKAYVEFIRKGPPLVACSESTARGLRELNPMRDISVMPYFVSAEEITTSFGSGATSEVSATFQKLNVGFVGRLESSKGIDLLVKASADPELADICWHFFGDGSQAELIQGAASPNLVWHGAFDQSTPLAHIYGPLDAVVLPSSHVEGSPLCLIEAMAHGKPWVAFDRGGISELAPQGGGCIVVDPVEPGGFREGIKRMRSMIRNGLIDHRVIRAHYDANFSANAVSAKWEKFCRSILAGGHQ